MGSRWPCSRIEAARAATFSSSSARERASGRRILESGRSVTRLAEEEVEEEELEEEEEEDDELEEFARRRMAALNSSDQP